MSATGRPMRPMVLISSLATGGAERVSVSFLARLAREGRGVPVCTLRACPGAALEAELAEAGVRRFELRARRLADPLALARWLALVRREGVDLVHAHGQDASILAAAARPFTRVPLVVTRHVLDEPQADWRQRWRARAAFAAARHADAVVAVSAAAGDWLHGAARLARPPHVIHNGVELERFRGAGDGTRAAVRARLGIAPECPLVLVPAVLRAGKGHELLLAALPAIRARVPTACLAFAGGGEREAELRAAARPHGDAVRLLGPRDDVPELLAACDLVALPSRAEALPTALIEAAAAGRPAVATRVGGAPEVVDDGRTGVLVPPGDAGALAQAVADLLSDPARARALGAAARRRAAEHFDLARQIERTLALWREVAERNP